MGQFTFSKKERLNKEKIIQELFKKGSSFYLFPFKVMFLASAISEEPNQILISVSKRNFKTAPQRNLLKRRIREAYRLNKHLLPTASGLKIGLIFTHKEILRGPEISEKMVHALQRLSRLTSPRAAKS